MYYVCTHTMYPIRVCHFGSGSPGPGPGSSGPLNIVSQLCACGYRSLDLSQDSRYFSVYWLWKHLHGPQFPAFTACYVASIDLNWLQVKEWTWLCVQDSLKEYDFWVSFHAYNIQARSQGGFEGVRTNPSCSLAKYIFNETAAVQRTLI